MSSDELLNDKWLKKLDRQSQVILDRVVFNRKTFGEVFDRNTLLLLGKLISDGVIDQVDFPISTGKEANIFRGTTPERKYVAIKIYRTATMTFKHIASYIEGDPRFMYGYKNRREMIAEWARKEYKNLALLHQAKVRAPTPLKCIQNILVMSYIGDAQKSAPLLKDVDLRTPQAVFDEIMDFIEQMYKNQVVHGDLSAFNILMFRQKPYIIDVGQAVLLEHPASAEFLKRDIHNIVQHFKKYDIQASEKKLLERFLKKKT
ncbi:MAG: serine protein kinase RIO [Candidatus Thermoplasmatota archaeon]|nr:serine protein kinase RIO [Candidatus Thermoplasmatota archaeon]